MSVRPSFKKKEVKQQYSKRHLMQKQKRIREKKMPKVFSEESLCVMQKDPRSLPTKLIFNRRNHFFDAETVTHNGTECKWRENDAQKNL